ncbi:hypothetical protein HDV04_002756 [Boothiomyces sp. JEL0838]|nr:hypothetical protein HDV04_002756 [Boothiomyces sp. JEL0838]
MINIPILGRLNLSDYVRIVLAFTILIFEPILRIVFAILPLRWVVDNFVKRISGLFGPSQEEHVTGKTKTVEAVFNQLNSTEEFVNFWGFPFQTHYVTTKDGYILALHRIPFSRAENLKNKNNIRRKRSHLSFDDAQPNRPVVILWHGFLMCSEVWVSSPNSLESLALTLADAGYDVWLGNTRGNKYSCKHRKYKPNEEKFWDFSMDQLAMFDLPDSVDYILNFTGAPSLTYIGFSQGTAQGFSSLSINPSLNKKINLFIALAPATKPKGYSYLMLGLENQTIHSLVNASPEVIYLLFGRKALLSSVIFWQRILTPWTFSWAIDISMWGLFGWESKFMNSKHIIYRHLYSYTAVKCVVHWFQIMQNETFQMYNDSPAVMPAMQKQGYKVPTYPTSQIQTPIAIFHGGKDTLPDIRYILKNINEPVFCLNVQEYEHLQFLWGEGQEKVVFPAILGLLSEYSEVWQEASGDSSVDDTVVARTVPWITNEQIDYLYTLGQKSTRDKVSNEIINTGSKVSVELALKYGYVNPDDYELSDSKTQPTKSSLKKKKLK